MRALAKTRASDALAVRWLRFLIGLVLLVLFLGFLATSPLPPGRLGDLIVRNMDHDIQATALFYSDLERMQQIEQELENLAP